MPKKANSTKAFRAFFASFCQEIRQNLVGRMQPVLYRHLNVLPKDVPPFCDEIIPQLELTLVCS